MALKKKQKECFTGHVMMHGVFGLGLGFVLAAVFPNLPFLLIGLILCVGAFIADAMRK